MCSSDLSPRCIAPSIYALSKRKKWSVREALTDDAWIRQIDISEGLSTQNLQEFTNLWEHTSQLTLVDDVSDSIIWKLTTGGISRAPQLRMPNFRQHYPILHGLRCLEDVGAPPSVNFSHGSLYKTVFGRRIDLRGTDGLMEEIGRASCRERVFRAV